MMDKIFVKKFNLYRSMKSHDGPSLFSAVVMIDLKCCGYLNPFDFNEDTIETEDEYDGHSYNVVLLPIPCCLMDKDLKLIDIDCPKYHYMSENTHKHHNTGCKQIFRQKAVSYIAYLTYLSIILIVVNIALVVCVVLVLKELWLLL
ncbi:unnamed protein product [Schistosoma turkestanicum]|nr:unnamed protein product [Schistosoma turkestanicum]